MGRRLKFEFDMRTKDYLETIEKYYSKIVSPNKNSIKSDRQKFNDYYHINLSDYVENHEFIIPYEMSDLYCLMMATMKTAPQYDKRVKSYSINNMIDHKNKIFRYIENLPSVLSTYIKFMPEYKHTVYLTYYMPAIVERFSSIFYLIFNTYDPSILYLLKYLVESLDDVYERFFWEKSAGEYAFESAEENHHYLKQFGINMGPPMRDNLYTLDVFLSDLFNKLDRCYWPDKAYEQAMKFLKTIENAYEDHENKDEIIKYEYLQWLSQQEWHVLNDIYKNIYDDSYFSEYIIKSVTQYDPESTLETIMGEMTERSEIEESLRSLICRRIIRQLIKNCDDRKKFKEVFYQPYTKKYLRRKLYTKIESILENESVNEPFKDLENYLWETYDSLVLSADKYQRKGIDKYADEIMNGKKTIENSAQEIYMSMCSEIQSKKADLCNKKGYADLKNRIDNLIGQMFVNMVEINQNEKAGSCE